MLEIEILGTSGRKGPDCGVCGVPTRLCGSESHPADSTFTLVTYVCPICEAVAVQDMQIPPVDDE